MTGAAETAISGRQSPWPDEPFDAAVLDGFEGNIRLNSKRLTIADGIGIGQAGIDIALEGGKIDVKRIEGACLGGRCSASLRIDKAPAGVEVSGQLSLVGAALESARQQRVGRARARSGTIGGEIKFSGRGTSPRNALSALQGRRHARARRGQACRAVAGRHRHGRGSGAQGRSRQAGGSGPADARLRDLASGQLQLPGTVKLEIADGQLSIKPLAIDTAEGRAQGRASLDLRTLHFESEWRLDQKREPTTSRHCRP